jgi:hypothetical protein
MSRLNGSKPGPGHPNWRGGKTKVDRGHVRITAGPNRWQYEHRVIVREHLREWNFWGFHDIPRGWTVHHMDFREDHNGCHHNLILMPHAIHQSFIRDYRIRLANGTVWGAGGEYPGLGG